MIWVIFLMPTDHVMAFLCFITDSQLVDMSAQVICVRPGRWWGVIIEKNILLLFFMFWAIWSVLRLNVKSSNIFGKRRHTRVRFRMPLAVKSLKPSPENQSSTGIYSEMTSQLL